MKDYRSLPFATYDLAVYIPGGAVFLVLAQLAAAQIVDEPINFSLKISDSAFVNSGVEAILFLSASYLVGHLAAFISTYIIEKPLHNWLGYPSSIWFEREEAGADEDEELRKIYASNLSSYDLNISSGLAAIGHIPMFLPVIGFLWLKPFGFYTPKFPLGQLQLVKDKIAALPFRVEVAEGSRWDKIVEHYVANNCPQQFPRMYNYLVIYGALRMLALVIFCICWWNIVFTIYMHLAGKFSFSLLATLCALFLPFVYMLSVMAFAKFNRRYFEESLYIFLSVKESPPAEACRVTVFN